MSAQPNMEESVAAAVEALDEEALVDLAVDLVDTPSPTGHEEQVAELYGDRLRSAGLTSRVQPFAPGRSNVLGIHDGEGGGRSLMFNAHLDTRPADPDPEVVERANPPTQAQIADGHISGPGIGNMKGVLASYLAAISAIRRAGVRLAGDVLISGVAGGFESCPVSKYQLEEFRGFGVGTQHLLARGGVADMCVLGDPTSFKLVRAFFGVTYARVDIHGESVMADADRILRALNAWIPDYRRRATWEATPPKVTILAIEGGAPWTWNFPVSRCSIFVAVGTPPDGSPLAVKDELRGVLDEVRASQPNLDARVELYATNLGTAVPEDSGLVAAVRASHASVFGDREAGDLAEPSYCNQEHLSRGVVAWFCDAAHLNRYGVPTVNYGPHATYSPADSERLSIGDLLDCTRVYIDLIIRACGPRDATGSARA